MKKSVCILYIEFFHPQDMKELESTLRIMAKKRKFPSFRKMIPMIHYKNLTTTHDKKTLINPLIIIPDPDD